MLLLILVALWLLGSGAMLLMAAGKQNPEAVATQVTVTAQTTMDIAMQNQLTAMANEVMLTAQAARVAATAQAGRAMEANAAETAQADATMKARARAMALARARATVTARTRMVTSTTRHDAATATVSASPVAGNPVTILGVPSPKNYCQVNEYGNAVIIGSKVYGWACETGAGQPTPISMMDVCRWQFNDMQALDVLVTVGNSESWECITNAQKLGALTAANMAGYCQSIGDSGISLDGLTASDWYCVTVNGQHDHFDVKDACRWQFNDAQALGRSANYVDPNSWECWTGL